MKRPDLDRFVLPGRSWAEEAKIIRGLLLASGVQALLALIVWYCIHMGYGIPSAWELWRSLYYEPIPLWIRAMIFFFTTVTLLYLIAKVLQSYQWFRAARYTVRRLPNRWEMHRRCWGLFGYGIAGLAVTHLIVTLVFLILYFVFTPIFGFVPKLV